MSSNANYGMVHDIWNNWGENRSNFSTNSMELQKVDNRGQHLRPAVKQSNYNEYFIQKAEESLARLTELHQNDPYHIGEPVYHRALSLLSFLRHSTDLAAPMILPEGEEDVSLTWEGDVFKRYLSVSLDSVEMMDLNKLDHESKIVPLGEEDDIDYQKLISLMEGHVRTSSYK